MNLKKNAISGLKWSTTARIGRQVLQFITLIILARLLAPEEFGLMASAMVVIGFANVFRDLGISAAIIQRLEVTDELFSSVFWISALFGIILMFLLIIFAPIIANFFNVNSLIPILRVLSLSFLFSGFSIVQQAMLEKTFKFKNIAIFELSATFLGAIIGISLALLNYGVWSLVYQNLVFSFTLSLLILISLPQKPRFYFSFIEIKSIANFSGNLAGFNILNYFVRNADYILIQKFLGEQQLGYYTLAYRLMLYPMQNVTAVITRVMFPVLSKIQQDNYKFRDIYTKLANSIALLTFPLMLGLIAVSDNFVLIVFGSKWEPVASLILILAPLGLIQSIYTPAGMIYQAKGRTDWWFRWGIFTGVLFITAFWLGLKWGVIGVAFAYLIANILTFYPGLLIPFKLISLKVYDFMVSFKRTFIISLIMFLVVLFSKFVLNVYIEFTESLIYSVIIGLLVYSGLSFRFNKEKIYYVFNSLRN